VSPAGAVTLLYSFGKTPATVFPSGPLVEAPDGHLYGALAGPGGAVGGSVFRVTKAGALSLLHTFVAEGTKPAARIQSGLTLGSDGHLYAATCCKSDGSGIFPSGEGEIFQITRSGVFTSLESDADQFSMSAPIEGSDGNLYGVVFAPIFTDTTVYRLSTSGAYTALHEIHDGYRAIGGLVEMGDGVFYGTTYEGGEAGKGTVFRLTVP
jgi:uncharacterized repeat protein (TIGR03803 family)